jgi:hypothetical protein
MGGGGSKATSKSSTTIINKTLIDKTTETLNKNISNALFDNVQATQQSVGNHQELRINKVRAGGSFTLSKVDFSQFVKVNFDSVSESKVKTDSQASMMTSLFDTIKKNASADVQDKLASEAETLAGIGGIPAPSSESNSISEFRQENELNIKLKNVVANVVERNTKDMNVQKCSQSVRNSQVLPVYDVDVGEDVTIELIKMEQVTDAIMKCEMVKETSSKVVDQLVQELGLQVEDVSETIRKTDLKSAAKSSDALGEIGRGIGGMLKGFGMAGMVLPLIIGAVILIVLFKMIGSGGGTSKSKPKVKPKVKTTGKKQKGGVINNIDPNTLMIIGVLYIIYKLINKKEEFEMTVKLRTTINNKDYYLMSKKCENTCDKSVILVDDKSKADIFNVKNNKINIDACIGKDKQNNLRIIQNNRNIQLKGDNGGHIGICKFRGSPMFCNEYRLICVGEKQNALNFSLV